MNRLKLLGAVALLGVLACEDATPPTPVGSIVGQVAIEGTGVDGVSVNLSNGNATTTSGGGSFRFDRVESGAYTITISGYPPDATFDATSASAAISSAGQSVTVNFTGAYIRTASVTGTVTLENTGLGGVTVQLSGMSTATATTDDNGEYAFTGLRMGSYSVEISGFDSGEIAFSATASAVTVGVGESRIVTFDGTYLRTAGIHGRVSVQGEGLEGVTVSLSGGPDATDMTTETDAAGQYSFAGLRAGDYAVGISGYDTDDYEFEVTSQNVTVALGETANVPFEGVLLRTSGVSGRVSVEGMGLGDIPVTLSMGDEAADSAMTDAGGLYAFSGLAAGDYTVGIMVEGEAYVFETMSMDVSVGDDETAIVNFEGMHARTASVSGQLFIDELMKNDMHDEGEHPLPAPGVPVVLVGPGLNDRVQSATDSTGAYSFMGLRAGDYQLVVTITDEVAAALAMHDVAFGGSATGYEVSLDVGEAATQNLPFDITHTTVHFGVTLKAGDTRGMPLPGAMVTLYDGMGEDRVKVGEGMSMVNEETMHAVASIRVARAGTSDNTVYAGVAAEGYDAADGMTAVMWDPQSTYTMGANDNDIVNLNVDVTFGGATISTGYGGGDALAGWAVSVAHGDTMYADTLDTDGMAAFKTTVDSAGALPAMYSFSVDTIQDNKLDGGENFDGTAVEYTHTGLALAGTMDAGTIEVNYTTQTLKVGVHHELDQVMGYTGNVLDGDRRDGSGDDQVVTVDIRHIDDSGRSHAFQTTGPDAVKYTHGYKDGVHTFGNLPADARVIVTASVPDTLDFMLLDPGELAAYTDAEANGITGGHFGAHGGYSHTVSLCPLQATDPTDQDHDECSSFAYVNTHSVSGLVWKNTVLLSDDDANDDRFSFGLDADGDHAYEDVPTFVEGISVDLAPVEGKNLAGEAQSFTTLESNAKATAFDDTHEFAFNDIAAGVYKLTVEDGWRARLGPKDAIDMVGDALNPLAGDVSLDVTPATTTVYGYVRDSEGFPVEDVTVTANGVEATTDAHGRYIAEYVPSGANKRGSAANTNTIAVSTAHEGREKTDTVFAFAANGRHRADVKISSVDKTASISGTVTASGGDPVAGVRIMVDGLQESSFNAKIPPTSKANNALVTGDDGSYTAIFEARDLGESVDVSVSKDGMSFAPETLSVPAHAGSAVSGIDFTGFLHGTISGRVTGPGGNALGGIAVTATSVVEGGAGDEASTTSNARGTFSLSVPFGSYTVTATPPEGSLTRFSYPNDVQDVSVAPGESVDFGTIAGASVAARIIDIEREKNEDGNYSGPVMLTIARDTVPGFTGERFVVETSTDGGESWSPFLPLVVVLVDGSRVEGRMRTVGSVPDVGFHARVATDAQENGVQMRETSAPVVVGAVDSSPSDAEAERGVGEAGEPDAGDDLLTVTWKASTNTNTLTRVVMLFEVIEGVHAWLVAEGTPVNPIGNAVREWTLNITDFDAGTDTTWDFANGGGSFTMSTATLLKALTVRVETQQPGVTQDEDDMDIWVESNTVEVAAKES